MSRPPAQPQGRPTAPPRVDFICKPRFGNLLPDIPFDGKFLACPFVPLNRFIPYKPSILEKEYKFEVQCEHDMGVTIDLVDPETYVVRGDNPVVTDEKDLVLLEDENSSSLVSRRSAQHSKVVPWMRKTEYISSEFNRFGVSADRQEIKVGYHLKKNMENDNLYRDRQSQIDAINKTFDDVKKPVTKHYSKKGVEAVEELYVFPDFDLWGHGYAQVIFDADPSYLAVPEELRKTAMKESVIQGMQSEKGEQYVGYFSPSVETLQKKMEDKEKDHEKDPDAPFEPKNHEYMLNREYNWVVKNKASKGYEQDTFFLYQKGDSVFYNELSTQVKLQRRRRPNGQPKPNTILRVTTRAMTPEEMNNLTEKMNALLHPVKEEEDEEMEPDEPEEKVKSEASDDDNSGSARSNSDKDSGSDKSGSDSDSGDKKKRAIGSDDESD